MSKARRRILVIEDDPGDSNATRGFFSQPAATGSTWRVMVTTGCNALALSDYAVITIDRMLPDIDGIAGDSAHAGGGEILTPALIISALGWRSTIGCAGCVPAGTITSSSHLPSRKSWLASRRWRGAAPQSSRRPYCASAISKWTWYPAHRHP